LGLTTIGLFAGVGGIERGLERAGHSNELLCEIDPSARKVLEKRFQGVPLIDDIRALTTLPATDIVTAGFPCQDLSQAGRTKGIGGANSGLVKEVFRLLRGMKRKPTWIVLENVPFMLSLGRGRAMSVIVGALEELGYQWAYRTIDSRAFGLPQRRRRIFLVASRSEDPRAVLLNGMAKVPLFRTSAYTLHGFYWTEGNTGLGWAVNAVPPLKGGSRIGIPSPPAIWLPRKRKLCLPDIRDAERLQGLPAGWTEWSNGEKASGRERWRLVGNAVSVPVAEWIGRRLSDHRDYHENGATPLRRSAKWPRAAWGRNGKVYEAMVSEWPVSRRCQSLESFLEYPLQPLSVKATAGFLSRITKSTLNVNKRFIRDVRYHLSQAKMEL